MFTTGSPNPSPPPCNGTRDEQSMTAPSQSARYHSHAASSPLIEAVAGLAAGSAATIVTHPLDLVKTRLQVHRSATSTTPPSALVIAQSILRSPRPVASLYRGLAPNILGNASGWGSFFFFKSRFERALLARKAIPEPWNSPPRLAPAEFFVASALAGATTTLLTNPIWVLKTRLLSTDRAAAGAYPGFLAGVARLWRDEGVRGFYRGLGASLLGVSHGAVQFAVYEPAKRFYLAHRPQPAVAANKLDNDATVAISTIAKLVAGAATYPYQVVRSRLQNHEAEARYGRGIAGVVARVWREEGPRGFYRGVMLGMVRVMPATWVTFLVYENVRFHLPRWLDGGVF